MAVVSWILAGLVMSRRESRFQGSNQARVATSLEFGDGA
jgi:hypothetical protein